MKIHQHLFEIFLDISKAIRPLVEAGANIDAINDKQKTPLSYAIFNGDYLKQNCK